MSEQKLGTVEVHLPVLGTTALAMILMVTIVLSIQSCTKREVVKECVKYHSPHECAEARL